MKTKEIKELAKKIAKEEFILRHSEDENKIAEAKGNILYYSNLITSIEDMAAIDDKVVKILNKMEASI
ncbi:MAG: hypothetical protein J6I85_05240 [Clostridia bacterium]|jgi:hypothetical protein|nr:hypothetical protein [Clostridia bacterium]